MRIDFDSRFQRKLKKISKKNIELYQTFLERLELLRKDPEHKSLRVHKVISKKGEVFSLSVTYKARILFEYVNGGILLTDIGSHDEVY